jgi:hypothetical protein
VVENLVDALARPSRHRSERVAIEVDDAFG